jgi:hypothetical protein
MFGGFAGVVGAFIGFGLGWQRKEAANAEVLQEQYEMGLARGIIEASAMFEEFGVGEIRYQ